MGTHLAPKAVGDPLTIEVTYTPTTKDAAGQPINWNYALEFQVINTSGVVVQSGSLATLNNVPSGGARTLTTVIPARLRA
jgi:hypothetical protein